MTARRTSSGSGPGADLDRPVPSVGDRRVREERWNRVQDLTFGELDRGAVLDLVTLVLGAFVLYIFVLLPGVGWGTGAELQARAALYGETAEAEAPPGLADGPGVGVARRLLQDLVLWPSGVFIQAVGFGSPAWRFNLLMIVVSILTLAILYLTMRLVVARRTAAVLAATAVVFSHGFFLHAVRPSPWPFLALLYAAQQHQAVRHLLLGETFPLISLWVFALTGVVLAPELAAAFLAPAFFATLRDWTGRSWVFWLSLVVAVITVTGASTLGRSAYPILAVYIAIQYPVLGWLLAGWGIQGLRRRLRPIGELVAVSLASAVPLAVPSFLPDALGSLVPASLATALLLASGSEYLLDRIRPRRELATYAIPMLFVALAALPLVSTIALATAVRSGGIDRRFAAERPFGIELRDNPWCDAVWYALWPPKNGQGGERFLREAEALLPPDAFLLADPDVLPVVGYAQRVEGRLSGLTAATLANPRQTAELLRLAAAGKPVFLAGVDPSFYDVAALGAIGSLDAVGNFYRWTPLPDVLETARVENERLEAERLEARLREAAASADSPAVPAGSERASTPRPRAAQGSR